jgi:quercetin dioxygenase-like cupin family protein
MSDILPDPIQKLPEADLPFPGVKAYLSQSEDHQIIFMEFSQDVEVPAHAHAAQLGIVLEGRIDMVIDGKEYIFSKGDRYFIPAGTVHSAKIHAGYADVTFFAEPDRYRRK